MTETPQTVAGAIRAHLALAIPELPVYRENAPQDTTAPVAVIFDGLSTSTAGQGRDIILTETVQIDLYTNTGDDYALPDDVHAALHGAAIWLPRSQVHSVQVTSRTTDTETDDDGLTRTIYTIKVIRRLLSINDPNEPFPPREPAVSLLAEHEAKTTNVHGIANTAELETQTGAQAKADNAESAAIAYTDEALANISLDGYVTLDESGHIPVSQIPSLDYDAAGAAAAAQIAAIDSANAYTDAQIAAIDLSALATTEYVDTADANTLTAAQEYTDTTVSNYIPKSQKGQPNGVATLDANGIIPTAQVGVVPSDITITVNSEAEMLAITTGKGTIARRTDESKTYILQALPATDINNWVIWLTPPDAVLTVDGRIGIVSLSDLYDPLGAADEAYTASQGYTDTAMAAEVTRANAAYDAAGAAAAAQAAAIAAAAADATAKANAAQAAAMAEQRTLVRNTTGATLTKGTVVYIDGANGTHVTVAKASASTETTSSRTFGLMLADTPNNADGYVVTAGTLEGIDTSGASADGDTAWLGTTAGTMVYGYANRPVAPNNMVFLGIITRKNPSNGAIFIKVANGLELDELHDVNPTANGTVPLADKNVLVYDSAAGYWKGSTINNFVSTVIGNDTIPAAKTSLASLSVHGRPSNSSGQGSSIAAAADGDVLRRSGTTLGFGKIDANAISQTSGGNTATAEDILVWNGSAWTIEPNMGDFGYVSTYPHIFQATATASPGSNVTAYVRLARGGTINNLGVFMGTGTGSTTIQVSAYSNTGEGFAAQPYQRIATTAPIAVGLGTSIQYAGGPIGSTIRLKAGDWLAVSLSTSVNIVGATTLVRVGAFMTQASAATPPATATPLAPTVAVAPLIVGQLL